MSNSSRTQYPPRLLPTPPLPHISLACPGISSWTICSWDFDGVGVGEVGINQMRLASLYMYMYSYVINAFTRSTHNEFYHLFRRALLRSGCSCCDWRNTYSRCSNRTTRRCAMLPKWLGRISRTLALSSWGIRRKYCWPSNESRTSSAANGIRVEPMPISSR